MLDQQTLQVVFHSLLYLHWLNTWEKTEALPEAAPPSPSPKTLRPVYHHSTTTTTMAAKILDPIEIVSKSIQW